MCIDCGYFLNCNINKEFSKEAIPLHIEWLLCVFLLQQKLTLLVDKRFHNVKREAQTDKISTLKNLEVAICYSKDFNRELRSNLTYFQNNLFRANSRNCSNVIKCIIIFYCKSNNNLQSHSNHDIVFNCNFGTRQVILNISCPVFWIRHNIFPDISNKGAYGILFTLTQNAYLYTPVHSYALHIPVFTCIPPAYKNFYFPYLGMFYEVKGFSKEAIPLHIDVDILNDFFTYSYYSKKWHCRLIKDSIP